MNMNENGPQVKLKIINWQKDTQHVTDTKKHTHTLTFYAQITKNNNNDQYTINNTIPHSTN